MNKNDVKIMYCHDKNKQAIHYMKTIKGQTYYCVDCGAELIVKQGKIKIKHLAHKNTEHCGGSGESIFHKHWKENLFKEGMYIKLPKLNKCIEAEILNVYTEVSLKNKYNMMHWDKNIIVDVLLETTEGDVIIEIFYSNSKNWLELDKYYAELNINFIFEVKTSKCINEPLQWIDCIDEIRKLKIKQQKLEQLKHKQEAYLKILNSNKYYLNYTCKPIKITDNVYDINCIAETKKDKAYSQSFGTANIEIIRNFVTLQFNLSDLNCTYDYLFGDKGIFTIKKGLYYCELEIEKITDTMYKVKNYSNLKEAVYNKSLYAQVCQVNKFA